MNFSISNHFTRKNSPLPLDEERVEGFSLGREERPATPGKGGKEVEDPVAKVVEMRWFHGDFMLHNSAIVLPQKNATIHGE